MDAVSILLLLLAVLVAWTLVRLAVAVQRNWSGDIEDLFEDIVIHRMMRCGIAVVLLVAALLLQGRLRSLLVMASG